MNTMIFRDMSYGVYNHLIDGDPLWDASQQHYASHRDPEATIASVNYDNYTNSA